jgi:hypothetical protein
MSTTINLIFSLFLPFLLPHVFQSFITHGTATERKKKPYTHNLLYRTLFLAETETFVWPPQRANEEEFQSTLTTTIFLPNGSESKRKVKKWDRVYIAVSSISWLKISSSAVNSALLTVLLNFLLSGSLECV